MQDVTCSVVLKGALVLAKSLFLAGRSRFGRCGHSRIFGDGDSSKRVYKRFSLMSGLEEVTVLIARIVFRIKETVLGCCIS